MEYEESIYNLIPKERYEPPKSKRYRSGHPADMPPTCSTFGLGTTSRPGVANVNGNHKPGGGSHGQAGNGATFGKPKGALKPDTTGFRKKGTGTMALPDSKLRVRADPPFRDAVRPRRRQEGCRAEEGRETDHGSRLGQKLHRSQRRRKHPGGAEAARQQR